MSFSIGSSSNLLRILNKNSHFKKNKQIANKAFQLWPNDKEKLSFDYEPLTTPIESLARNGATFKSNAPGEYKNPEHFTLCRLEVKFLRELEKRSLIVSIVPDPIESFPNVKGRPQNSSHTLVQVSAPISEEDMPEWLAEMTDHANAIYISNPVDIDMKSVIIRTMQLRELDCNDSSSH